MRTALVLLLSIACLAAAAAGAREPAGILRYGCDPSTPRLELSVRDAGGDHVVWGENVELIDVEALQTFGEPDARGMPWRTGSEVLVRDCGPYRVEIRAGFYNANPNGEMGAADAYPIVTLSGAGGGRSAVSHWASAQRTTRATATSWHAPMTGRPASSLPVRPLSVARCWN